MKKSLILSVLCLWLTALLAQCDKTNDIIQNHTQGFYSMAPLEDHTMMVQRVNANMMNDWAYIYRTKKHEQKADTKSDIKLTAVHGTLMYRIPINASFLNGCSKGA